MNIGETDAESWTYVRFGDAAKAAQDGTHEVQFATQHRDDAWHLLNGEPWINATWRYRMREKARTITVTIPCPQDYANVGLQSIQLICKSQDDLKQTRAAIKAAMEQS